MGAAVRRITPKCSTSMATTAPEGVAAIRDASSGGPRSKGEVLHSASRSRTQAPKNSVSKASEKYVCIPSATRREGVRAASTVPLKYTGTAPTGRHAPSWTNTGARGSLSGEATPAAASAAEGTARKQPAPHGVTR
jgi:hypothetical protein